jgi:hypothetical protein
MRYGWMSNAQFLDGIALGGILPAPLIIFSTFVGYFGGGWGGAILITFGFSAAFYLLYWAHVMEKIISNPSLHRFLDGVTAGVIADCHDCDSALYDYDHQCLQFYPFCYSSHLALPIQGEADASFYHPGSGIDQFGICCERVEGERVKSKRVSRVERVRE